jgi:SAM-dependent methyltransferase
MKFFALALRSPLPARRERRAPDLEREFALLAPRFTPRTVFMEVGGPDCALALRAAGYVERVYAIDVSGQFIQGVRAPANLRLVLCDGVRIPVPEGVVDVAYSNAFMDHLHPDDAREHLESVRRSLAPGGVYLCTTRAARRRFLAAGFSALQCYAGALRIPSCMARLAPAGLLRFAARR